MGLQRIITASVVLVLGLSLSKTTQAQQVEGGCLRLLGSVACPAYQYAYLSPSNLSNAYPFFSTVDSVASFDAAALEYFSNPYQFTNTKFGSEQLGCSNASAATIRYERTVQCSKWVNERWSLGCTELYNSSTAATSMKMVCQSTCLQYSASENEIAASGTYCPGPDLTSGTRQATLLKDYVDCTNWTKLATNDTATCIRGEDNEPNCGYGGSTQQLCDFCRGDSPDDCCYEGTTDVAICGYVLPARPSTSSAVPTNTGTSAAPSSTGTTASDNAGTSKGLKGGRLAGTIVGAVLGGLLLLALLIFLFMCLRRRKTDPKAANNRDSGSSFAASQAQSPNPQMANAGIFGTLFGGHKATGPQNTSEKGLLGLGNHSSAMANVSSPTMGGDTLYAPSAYGIGHSNGGNKYGKSGSISPDGAGLGLGATAAAAAAAGSSAFGGGPGNRNSGTVLPRVRDENQNGNVWIEPGMEVTVLWPYTATLPDELDLRPGMRLRVVRLYDDAWGTAEVISGASSSQGSPLGKNGAFPIVCVSEGSSLGSSGGSSDSH
ncbi:hypothetical protein I317_00514 [Kwoniella heveanensis CBS 569]|nr:hypothetical protein I317_00514 [Kwoniella heveanensis CBS 569]